MLTGQAKTDYQREYMRKRRSNKRNPNVLDPDVELSVTVRPNQLDPEPTTVRPVVTPLSVREELEQTPLAELEAKGGWIPNWRREQG